MRCSTVEYVGGRRASGRERGVGVGYGWIVWKGREVRGREGGTALQGSSD